MFNNLWNVVDIYVVLFAIIFCETGLVVTPFLPGDSLLFAVGALAATEDARIQLVWLIPLLIVAAVAGDAVNYACGRFVGPKVFQWENSRWFNKRAFAPFVAGVAAMNRSKFTAYNVAGADHRASADCNLWRLEGLAR